MGKPVIVIQDTSLYKPIACDKHDYLETACLYRYDLIVYLRKSHKTVGKNVSAQARTIKTSLDKKEYFVVEAADAILEIAMDQLENIVVKTMPAIFDGVRFQ